MTGQYLITGANGYIGSRLCEYFNYHKKKFIPLSSKDSPAAEIMMPRSARSEDVNHPTAGFGIGPNRKTFAPTDNSPAINASSTRYPDNLGSLPMTTRFEPVDRRNTPPLAAPTRAIVSTLIGQELAKPTIPSTPKSFVRIPSIPLQSRLPLITCLNCRHSIRNLN